MLDDAELLERWREGDAALGNELVKRHFVAVYRFFRNKTDGELDDLVQQTFLKCVQARDRVQAFRPYLFTVARTVLHDHRHADRRRPDRVGLRTSRAADGDLSPTGALARREEERLLLAALRAMPLEDQILLELVYWEKFTGGELADFLGVPEGTARTRLRSARIGLEAKLAELGRSSVALRSTLDNLDRWSESLRDRAGAARAEP